MLITGSYEKDIEILTLMRSSEKTWTKERKSIQSGRRRGAYITAKLREIELSLFSHSPLVIVYSVLRYDMIRLVTGRYS
jgi:hypothetical protein